MEALGLTIYLTGRAPTVGDVAAAAQGPTALHGGDFVSSLAGGRIRLNRMPAESHGRHVAGLAGYLQSCDIHERALPARLAQVVEIFGVIAEPGVDLARDALPFARRLVGELGGFLFVRGVLLDAELACLARPTARAVPERTPPGAERVLARARVLAAVARRAVLEPDGSDEELGRLREACAEVSSELEPEELALVAAPIGALGERQVIDASWRIEGLAVLAWALGLRALGPHDEESEAAALVEALARQASVLRPTVELAGMASSLLTIHWRLVEWRVNPRPIDLESFVARASFGPLSVAGVPLADGDLAIAGVAIAAAPPERVRLATSVARERHRAANWLLGDHPIYSHVGADT